LNPLDRYERFQFTSILLSRTLHDATGLVHAARGRALVLGLDRHGHTLPGEFANFAFATDIGITISLSG
jgi:hypothetical protein